MEGGKSNFENLTGKTTRKRPPEVIRTDESTVLKWIAVHTRNWTKLVQESEYWGALVFAALTHLVP